MSPVVDNSKKLQWVAWGLWLVLVLRMLALAFVLEPTCDEGLWLWNPRCDTWGLPSYGITHCALSPGSYWTNRLWMWVTTPSLLGARLLHVLMIGGVSFLFIRSRCRQGEMLSALVVLGALMLDPHGLRAWSWAMIEPQVMVWVGIAWWLAQREPTFAKAIALGLVMGVALAVKISCLWVLALALPQRMQWTHWIRSGLVVTLALATALAFFYWTFLHQDAERFKFVWEYHTVGRLNPLKGALDSLRGMDVRFLWYVGILAGYAVLVWLAFRHGVLSGTRRLMGITILGGTAYALLQGYLPPHYLTPLGVIAALEIAMLVAALKVQVPQVMVLGGAALLVIVSAGSAAVFARSQGGDGAKALQAMMQQAHESGYRISAHPMLAIHVRSDVLPASTFKQTTTQPEDRLSAIDVWVTYAATDGPTENDRVLGTLEKARVGRRVIKHGLFVVHGPADWAPPQRDDAWLGWRFCR